jgi:hypothetical protein
VNKIILLLTLIFVGIFSPTTYAMEEQDPKTGYTINLKQETKNWLTNEITALKHGSEGNDKYLIHWILTMFNPDPNLKLSSVPLISWAAKGLHIGFLKELIKRGVDVNIVDGDINDTRKFYGQQRQTPLHYVIETIDHEYNINTYRPSEDYKNLEKIAIEIIEILIKNGADIYAKDSNYHSPIYLAKKSENKNISKVFEEAFPKRQTKGNELTAKEKKILMTRLNDKSFADGNLINLIKTWKLDPNYRIELTPIISWAIKLERTDLFKELIKMDAKVNVATTQFGEGTLDAGWTPLHHAAERASMAELREQTPKNIDRLNKT